MIGAWTHALILSRPVSKQCPAGVQKPAFSVEFEKSEGSGANVLTSMLSARRSVLLNVTYRDRQTSLTNV